MVVGGRAGARAAFTCLVVLLGIGCASGPSWPADPPQPQLAEAWPHEDALWLTRTRTVIFPGPTLESGARIVEHRRLQVLTPDGRSAAAFAHFSAPQRARLVDWSVRTLAPDGHTSWARATDLTEYAGGDDVHLTDANVFAIRVPNVVVGAIVDAEATLELDGAASLAPFAFADQHPTLAAELVVDAPAGFRLRADVRADAGPILATDAAVGERHVWRWRAEAARAAIHTDERSPRRSALADQVHVAIAGPPGQGADLASWSGIAAYAHALWAARAELPPALQATYVAPFAALPRESQPDAVLDRVRARTRYASVQLGIGGYQPMGTARVDRQGWGDCKGLTNLAVQSLRALGHDAFPVLVGFDTDGHEARPSLGAFDHVVVGIAGPEGSIRLGDPTDRLAFGTLSAALDGTLALALRPGVEAPFRAPTSSEASHVSVRTVALGRDSIHVRVEARGEPARELLRLEEEAAPRPIDDAAQRALPRGARLVPGSARLTRLDRASAVLEADGTFVGATPHASLRTVRLGLVFTPDPRLEAEAERASPLQLDAIGGRRTVLELTIPPGARVRGLPKPTRVENEVGLAELTVAQVDDRVRVELFERTRRGVLRPPSFDALRALAAPSRAAADALLVIEGGAR